MIETELNRKNIWNIPEKTRIFAQENKDAMAKSKNLLDDVINDKGEIDYVRIQELSSGVISGNATIARLNRQEERGRIEGGRTNVEATLYLGAAIGHDRQKHLGGRNILSAAGQESALEEYAKKANVWHTPERIEKEIEKKAVRKQSGSEADVYFMPDGFVIKVVIYNSAFSRTPLEYLDNRISLNNYLFNETKYELIGFAADPYKDEGEDGMLFIIRQTEIKGRVLQEHAEDAKDRYATEKKIKDAIAAQLKNKLGLVSSNTPVNYYSNSDYKVSDFHLGNVMEAEDRNILNYPDEHLYYIDVAPALNTDSDIGGVREYQDFSVQITNPLI